MFNEDAIIGSRELEITLTARQKDSPNPVPMCGVPHHAAAGYIAKLVRKGYRVAICDQAEEAGKGVKLVRREVVRVITPGTAIDEQLIDAREPTYLASIYGKKDQFAAAFIELSTGQLCVTSTSGQNAWNDIIERLKSFSPKEILIPDSLEASLRSAISGASSSIGEVNSPIARLTNSIAITSSEDREWDLAEAENVIKQHFKIANLASFAIEDKPEAISAVGRSLQYVEQTQRSAADHISSIEYFEPTEWMVLDDLTLRNLEILDNRNTNDRSTLFGLIDEAVTGMGSRLLRQWLVRPSLKIGEIRTRQDAITELSDTILRDSIRHLLKAVSDLERLIGRLNLGTASPRDIKALGKTVSTVPDLNDQLNDARSLLLNVLQENLHPLPEVTDLINKAINDELPANISEGGVIRNGFDPELDELRSISSGGKQMLAEFEDAERLRTGISNLKIRFNNVFGYYIEVSKGNISKVPEDYTRKQTLANAERFTTSVLKEWEQKILGAEDRISRLESEIFQKIKTKIASETQKLQATARAIATLDALCALAHVASIRNFVCPQLHTGDELTIHAGRHPIVEAAIGMAFVPNDTHLDNSTNRLHIITGANMGGKSTLLRQIALIQVLAQIGSFVPAGSASLPIIDRIWTRVGASDDLASGRSTFMVEMTETAAILRNATPKSLILLDEIGRGTSTFDGMSIAWAVAEYLHDSPDHSAKTLFATHYHELTELAEKLPGAKNYQMTATEADGEVVFLHKIQPGRSSKSYGIAVAQLAGLPSDVVLRAKEVLERLEKYELAVLSNESSIAASTALQKHAAQTSLFAIANESVIDTIREIDINALSPEEAKQMLESIRSRLI